MTKFIASASAFLRVVDRLRRDVPDLRAVWIGARALQFLGDTEGLPTRHELDEARL